MNLARILITPTARIPKPLMILAIVFPLFMAFGYPASYLSGMHKPEPHSMSVQVIGTTSQAAQIAQDIEAEGGDAVVVDRVASAEQARQDVKDLKTRAAYDPATGELFIASAGGRTASAEAQSIFEKVASQQRASAPKGSAAAKLQLKSTDLQKRARNDTTGSSFLYMIAAAAVSGYLASALISLAAGRMRLWRKLTALGALTLAAAVVIPGIVYGVYGLYEQNLVLAALTVGAVFLTVSVVQLGLSQLLGVAAVAVGITLWIILGIPATGIAVTADMMPPFFSSLHTLLPTGAGGELLRRVIYADGAGSTRAVLVLCVWGLIGAALLWVGHLRGHELHTGESDVALASSGSSPRRAPAATGFGAMMNPLKARRVLPPSLQRTRVVTSLLAFPVALMAFMPLIMTGMTSGMEPEHMKVAVVGPESGEKGVQKLADDLDAKTGAQFDVTRVRTADGARNQVADRTLRAAYDPATGKLYEATADGSLVTRTVHSLFQSVADETNAEMAKRVEAGKKKQEAAVKQAQAQYAQAAAQAQAQGQPAPPAPKIPAAPQAPEPVKLTSEDVRALADEDPMGTSALYLSLGAALGGLVAGLVLGLLPLSTPLRAGMAAVFPLVIATGEILLGWAGFGIFSGVATDTWAMLLLLSLTAEVVTLGGLLLAGPAVVPLAFLLVPFIGMSASGITGPLDMAHGFYSWAHSWIFSAQGFSAVRDSLYFEDVSLAGPAWNMVLWALAGALMWAAGTWMQLRRHGRAPGESENSSI